MIYDNTETRILEQVYLQPGIHMRALSKQLKLSMPSISTGLKNIKTLLIEERSGNQIKFSIDYSKEEIIPALYLVEHSRIQKLPAKARIAIRDFLKNIKEKPLITIIFGSYAKVNYTKESDIDILLVFQKLEDRKNIETTAKNVSMRSSIKLSPVSLDSHNFKESFHNSSKNCRNE